MTLLDDLTQWESGALSRSEVLALHATADKNLFGSSSTADLEAVLDLHERLLTLDAELVAYRESDWDRLRAQLPDRLVRRRSHVARLVGRPLVAASMVVGLSAAAAAASPAAREQVMTAWHRIEHVVGIGDGSASTHPEVSPSPRAQDGLNHSGAPTTPGAPGNQHHPAPTPQPTPSQTPSPTGGGGSNGGGTSGGSGSATGSGSGTGGSGTGGSGGGTGGGSGSGTGGGGGGSGSGTGGGGGGSGSGTGGDGGGSGSGTGGGGGSGSGSGSGGGTPVPPVPPSGGNGGEPVPPVPPAPSGSGNGNSGS